MNPFLFLMISIGGVNPFKDSNQLLIFAHRAGAQVVPENTIEGWKESKSLYNPDVWELDVHLTADDSLVVLHDETVDRTTNGSGNIREMTFDELRKLDAGFWFTPDSGLTFPWRNKGVRIPTMAEVFDSFPDDLFNIEIKDSLIWEADILVSLVKIEQMEEQVMIASVYTPVLERVRKLDSKIATSGSESEIKPLVLWGKVGLGSLVKTPMDAVQVPEYSGSIRVVTPNFVKLCHKKGLKVHVWTVNESDDMERLIKLGVDGIISDRPDVADRVAKTLGLRKFTKP
ncbi:glycerophosphodiester phosphodiesterase [bacterium]|nr:glycerophosphodiester phosphodiesterase [bacterium]